MTVRGTIGVTPARLAELLAVEREAKALLAAVRFTDAVLAKVRLERLVGGHRSPAELDATEVEWTKRRDALDRSAAARATA